MSDSKYDILFEPVKIGPCTTKNRFYAAPHGVGYGYRQPSANAAIRGIKAEGGWGVVCTEQVEIHPSSDLTPAVEHRIWDDRDLPALAVIAERVHQHGALAAIQLSHSGANATGFDIREPPIGPSTIPIEPLMPPMPEPFHARGMDSQDIRELRNWHRQAAQRGVKAGFDIIYVYASLLLSLPNQFLSKNYNHRTDEYGGSLKNRMRLLRELAEDTQEVANGNQAVAIRLTIDELLDEPEKGYPDLCEFFDRMGEIPDLWDIVVCGMGSDAGSSRFDESVRQRSILSNVKNLTSKPVVSVSVFTTPDEMVDVVQSGVLDLVAAARPSIADPFLPKKIQTGKIASIRPCIKCNICVACDLSAVSVQCTQNPTFGEEWRLGWHPEQVPRKTSDEQFLVVGAGPAGLECANVLSHRGYHVTLCDSADKPGGRVTRESALPGLELWAKARDFRVDQLAQRPNTDIRLKNPVSAGDILSGDHANIIIATGARWRKDGLDRQLRPLVTIQPDAAVLTPDDIMDGFEPAGSVCIYDDDHYYMGSVIAERLVQMGCSVTFITPRAEVAAWTHMTMEQFFIQQKLLKIGVKILPHRRLSSIAKGTVETACVFSGEINRLEADFIVLVTARASDDSLYRKLLDDPAFSTQEAPRSISVIGDAFVPGLIAGAIRSGHKYGREFGAGSESLTVARRDIPLPFSEDLDARVARSWKNKYSTPDENGSMQADPGGLDDAVSANQQQPEFRLPVIEIAHTGNQEQAGDSQYLLSGFRNDLITALTRFRDWVVVEPGSRETSLELDYRVETFCSDIYGQIYFNVVLLDAGDNRFIWSDRYPLSLGDWKKGQLDLIRRLAASLNVYLSEERLSRRTAAQSLPVQSYDKWLRGEDLVFKWDPQCAAEAETLFRQIIEEAPDFAPGHCSLASLMNVRHLVFPGIARDSELIAQSLDLARRSVAIDPLETRAHLTLAWSYSMSGEFDQANMQYELAYDLNPNNPRTLISCAQGFAFTGKLDRANELEEAALVLSPVIPEFLWAYLAATRFILGRCEDSIEAANNAGNVILDMPGWKAVSYAELGRRKEAERAGRELLTLVRNNWNGDGAADDRSIVKWFLTSFPIRDQTTISRLESGLKFAGLPV